MESNRDEASRCIELTKLYIKKNDLDNAWKFSVKANKLYPTTETTRLMIKLKSKLEKSKRWSMKRNRTVSGDSDTSYNGDHSNSSSSCDSNTQQSSKRSTQRCKSSTAYSYKMFKEINKDESYKCLERAEECIKKKQYERAEKYVLKSKKLFPICKADGLLKKIQEIKESSVELNYTKEQANLIEKVRSSENFYTMLDIKTTATVPEIKKAYKKLALLLHPDKNRAPGSGEVFIDIRNAFDTLCDHSKRKTYDLKIRKPSPAYRFCYGQTRHTTTYQPPYGAHRNPYRFYQRSSDSSNSSDDDLYYSEHEDNTYYYESFYGY